MRALLAAFSLVISCPALAAATSDAGPSSVGSMETAEPKAPAPRKGKPAATAPKAGGRVATKKGPAAGAPKVGTADRPKASGPVRAEPKVAGPKAGGPVVAGPRGGGPVVAGPRGGGPVVAGPRGGGPVVAGPKGGGPVVAGPKGGGPVVAGPRGGPVVAGPKGGPVAAGPRRPGGPVRTVVIEQVSPAHGIFIYGPRPGTHNSYTGQDEKIARRDLPDRSLDRGGSLAVGMLGGATISSEADGSAIFGDPGAGLQARFRPVEFLGIQVGGQHSVGWMGLGGDEPLRESTMGTASLQLFAFPWSHVSPFVTAGATMQDTDVSMLGAPHPDDSKTLWGPHAGLGLEIGLGRSVAIDLDGRLNYLVNAAANAATPTVFTTNLGLLFHF